MVAVVLGLTVPVAGSMPWPARLAGIAVTAAGASLAISVARLFARERTNIVTFNDPDRLVTTGPFRWTRNPMYLGLAVSLLGVALIVGALSAFLAPLAFVAAAGFWYIPFEEARAHAVFGAEYDCYRARVPRWLGFVRRARMAA